MYKNLRHVVDPPVFAIHKYPASDVTQHNQTASSISRPVSYVQPNSHLKMSGPPKNYQELADRRRELAARYQVPVSSISIDEAMNDYD